MLSRAEIIAKASPRRGTVDVPEWGGAVGIRSLTLAERATFAAMASGGDTAEAQAALIAWLVERGAVDADGAPIFGAGEASALDATQAPHLNAVARAVVVLSGLGTPIEEQAGN